MDVNGFRDFGYASIDYVADYMENVHHRPVSAAVEPGYLHKILPSEVSEKGENWQDVLKDVDTKIVPGLTHWQSNNFHAYYVCQNSYPSIVGDMIANGLGALPITWKSSPAATELEVIVVDWLAKLLGLPEFYLNSSEGPGGGILQGTASESMLIAMLAAREQAVECLKIEHSNMSESDIRGKLVMYSSDQCNCCVEKTALLAAVPIRLLPTDDDLSLRGETLQAAIDEDIRNGKIPLACIATHGTTGTCAFDNMLEIGPICRDNNIWLHIDAAYAGAALSCPELRHLMPGIEYSDSYNFNLHKLMLVNLGSSALWFRNTKKLVDAFTVDRTYLEHRFELNSMAPEYRHWQIQLGHPFRAMKVWCTMRIYGAEGIRENVRNHVRLARKLVGMIKMDSRFEIVAKPDLGLVCFRLKGSGDDNTKRLLDLLDARNNILLSREIRRGKLIIRFVINGMNPTIDYIEYAWKEIVAQVDTFYEKDIDHKAMEVNGQNLIEFDAKHYILENLIPAHLISSTVDTNTLLSQEKTIGH